MTQEEVERIFLLFRAVKEEVKEPVEEKKPAEAKRKKAKAILAPTAPTTRNRPTIRNRRCVCGICPKCLDEARWERIYNERFKDPDYYTKGLNYGLGSTLDKSKD